MADKTAPTATTYAGLQAAFDHFNAELFDGRLPACMITLRTFGKARGYFSPDRFVHLAEVTTTHEIALDPRQFIDRTTIEILSTLAHEMVHLDQRENGKPSRSGYHNREWADGMEAIGLIPSDTAKPGGKRTGQRVSHYIESGGRFETVATALLEDGTAGLDYADIEGLLMTAGKGKGKLVGPNGRTVKAPARRTGRSGTRTKYVCGTCSAAVWGKPDLLVACGSDHDPDVMAPVS